MTQRFTITTQNPAPERGSSFQASPMRMADLVYGIWAISPAMLDEIESIYAAHLRGPKIDLAAVEARLGRPLENKHQAYQVINGVAVLPIEGVIAPKANLFTQISGGASAQLLARDMRAAGADPAIKAVIQAFDTPGGNVLGIPEYAQAARDVAAIKPVVTYTDGQMASAGMWMGSAGNHIFASGSTTEIGSIGVITKHIDQSAADEAAGRKVTVLSAGRYKAVGNPHTALTKPDRAHIQDSLDYCYSLFVEAIAANRSVSVDTVLERMADGRVFRGQQALDAGLVDGFSTLEALIESMATDPARYARRGTARIKPLDAAPPVPKKSASAGAAPVDAIADPQVAAEASPTPTLEGEPMDIETLKRDHPQLHTSLLAAGAAAEQERVAAVRTQSLPGHEALIERLATDGKTTGPEAAMAVLAAERAAGSAAAAAHAADAPAPVKAAAPSADSGALSKQAQTDKAKAYAAEKGVGFVDAFKALGFAS